MPAGPVEIMESVLRIMVPAGLSLGIKKMFRLELKESYKDAKRERLLKRDREKKKEKNVLIKGQEIKDERVGRRKKERERNRKEEN